MFQKRFCVVLLAIISSIAAVRNISAAEPLLISDGDAQRHGLERAWFLQADVDRGRSRLQDLKLYGGILYMISDTSMVQAIDAESGASLWSKRIGKSDLPSMPLGVGGDMVAVINGSRLYVANRYNGDILFEHAVDGAPGGGPCVNERRVYVPTTTGMIDAYRIDLLYDSKKDEGSDEKKMLTAEEQRQDIEAKRQQKIRVDIRPVLPLFFRSKGRTLVQPTALRESKNDEFVSWPTDQGLLYISRVNRHNDLMLEIRSRIKTNAPITVQPAYLPPTPGINPQEGVIFFGSNDGFVMAVTEEGVLLWQFPTGEPIVQSPVSIGDRVYFTSKHGGLYCLDAMPDSAGRAVQRWFAPGPSKFLAASKKRVYAADRFGMTLVFDADTGARVDSMDTSKLTFKFTNVQTDRIYLATPEGLLQCLHEIGLKEPLRYDLDREIAAATFKPATGDKKASGKQDGADKADKADKAEKKEEKTPPAEKEQDQEKEADATPAEETP